ncbi:MAG TPA: SDR family NAD(P)-dependent oxidoreductase [Thermoleophilaceae bacterium]
MRRIRAFPAWAARAKLARMPSLDGMRALVTGAATGIGAATVARFRAEGAEVIGLDTAPGHVGPIADVTDPDQVTAAIASAGDLDICVANAGVSLMEPFVDGTLDSWRRVLEVNLLGVMTTFSAAVAAMPSGGRLLATASTAGLRGEPLASAYCASKAGLISIVRTLSIELAPRGINVNAVAPGQIETAMNRRDLDLVAARTGRPAADLLREQLDLEVPLRRLGTPEDVAGAFTFLAGPDAAYVTGAVLRVDGGLLSG